MTGQPTAWINEGSLRPEAVAEVLGDLPAAPRSSPAERAKYAARGRFLILPGDWDRFAASAAVAAEVIRSGALKILVAADTPAERDSLARFLTLAREAAGGASVTSYVPGEFSVAAAFQTAASVYGYLASPAPAILALSRDSFCRRTNLLRKPIGESGSPDLCALIAAARPVVLCSSRTVDGGRTLARNASVFDPAAIFVVAGENGRFRDAVIYRPEKTDNRNKTGGEPEQIGMF